jgi:hypothetical protein
MLVKIGGHPIKQTRTIKYGRAQPSGMRVGPKDTSVALMPVTTPVGLDGFVSHLEPDLKVIE